MQSTKCELLIIAATLAIAGCAQEPTKVPASEVPPMLQPASNVPPACAHFAGGWVGTWSVGNFGALRLWVTGVDQDCVATYAYGSGGLPQAFKTVKIQDGSLVIDCGTGGACQFLPHGDELWATYTSTSGNNSGVFKRMAVETK